jgi:hypothetical protein
MRNTNIDLFLTKSIFPTVILLIFSLSSSAQAEPPYKIQWLDNPTVTPTTSGNATGNYNNTDQGASLTGSANAISTNQPNQASFDFGQITRRFTIVRSAQNLLNKVWLFLTTKQTVQTDLKAGPSTITSTSSASASTNYSVEVMGTGLNITSSVNDSLASSGETISSRTNKIFDIKTDKWIVDTDTAYISKLVYSGDVLQLGTSSGNLNTNFEIILYPVSQ